MARQIFIVNATQVVASEAHPEGMFSTISGYPKLFDSRNYNATEENPDGDTDKALRVAKADYYSRLSANYAADNRAMTTVTLEMSNGRQIMCECIGAFPVIEPEIEPELIPEEPS